MRVTWWEAHIDAHKDWNTIIVWSTNHNINFEKYLSNINFTIDISPDNEVDKKKVEDLKRDLKNKQVSILDETLAYFGPICALSGRGGSKESDGMGILTDILSCTMKTAHHQNLEPTPVSPNCMWCLTPILTSLGLKKKR